MANSHYPSKAATSRLKCWLSTCLYDHEAEHYCLGAYRVLGWYPHALSNKGKGLIRGHIVPVAGIVSMNLAAFDVSDVPDVKVGDELILIGNAPQVQPV